MLSNITVAEGKSLLFPPQLFLCCSPPRWWGLGSTAAGFAVSLPAKGCQAVYTDAAAFPPLPSISPGCRCSLKAPGPQLLPGAREVIRLWTFAGGWLVVVGLKGAARCQEQARGQGAGRKLPGEGWQGHRVSIRILSRRYVLPGLAPQLGWLW